ncbi:hypothetical protein EZS27_015137 [termite gut metagenome]|uniref:Translation initiation factor IF-2 n=1 Tax=termite gut metagenome TaxID=433724 RepID=A0A5J4RUU3_9ZZZZ
MAIRLNKATRDLNVGIATVVEFLQKKGYEVEANPNAKITDEQYDELVKEFSKDKNLRLESERFIQERQNKERSKLSVSVKDFEKKVSEKPKEEDTVIKTVVPDEIRPKFKTVGKIILDKLSKSKKEEPDTKPVIVVQEEEKQPEIEISEEKTITVEEENILIDQEQDVLSVVAPAVSVDAAEQEKEPDETITLEEEKTVTVLEEEEQQQTARQETGTEKQENEIFKLRLLFLLPGLFFLPRVHGEYSVPLWRYQCQCF